MKATVEKVENRRATLTVEVEPEIVARALDRAYRNLVRRVQIPGFRKGRAPRFLVERYLGRAALYEEALDHLLPEAYSQAVTDTGIEPIDRPRLTVDSFDETTGLRFTAEVEVKPEVELGDYRAIRVEPPSAEVTPAEVDAELQRLRELHATLVPVEDGTAEKGMVAVIDFAGTVDGEPIPNGQAENYTVELGSGRLIDGVEDQILGMRPGEERDITVTFPEDHADENLRGKQATFHVRLKELKRKQLPEVDDEFAREVAGVAGVQELRERVEKELTQLARERARAELRRQVVERVVEGAQLEVPETLVNRRIDQLVDDMARQLRQQGIDLEQFLAQTGQTREQLREQFRERAVADVRTDLVLDAVGKREGIEATPQEVETEVRLLAAAAGQPYQQVRQTFARSGLLLDVAESIRRRKVIDRLVELATGGAAAETPETPAAPRTGDSSGEPGAKIPEGAATAPEAGPAGGPGDAAGDAGAAGRTPA